MLAIDVYQRYDEIINWPQIKADGIGAVWVKLTDGGGRANTPGDAYVHAAASVGIPVGGYHFAEATPTPEIQADVFADEVRRLNALGVAPILDLESVAISDPEGFRVRFWQHFAQRINAGKYLTYASESWWTGGQLVDSPEVPGEMVMDARFGTNTGSDQGTNLKNWDVHQYTSHGVLAGANGFIDLDNVKSNVFLDQPIQPVPPTPPAPPQPSPNWEATMLARLPELRQGAKDPSNGTWFVHRLQAILRDVSGIGLGPAGVDGDFGPATTSAVRTFQEHHGLAVDGIVGPHTWSVLVTGANF